MARELAELEAFEKEHGENFDEAQGDDENDLMFANEKSA